MQFLLQSSHEIPVSRWNMTALETAAFGTIAHASGAAARREGMQAVRYDALTDLAAFGLSLTRWSARIRLTILLLLTTVQQRQEQLWRDATQRTITTTYK
jgi:hypothetical protein